ncbi:MAG: DUF1330 domain-containing protein [Actinomycetota bacterium]|nr:DUF1330 domain-containing protein [Actinomycetota bacterium]
MAVYAVVNVQITDPDRYTEYRGKVPATIARYGGKYLARGGEVEVLEGDWNPQRLVIVEFESMKRFHEWYNSPEYAPLKQVRHEATVTQFVVVEGL